MITRNTISDGQIKIIYSVSHYKKMNNEKLHKVLKEKFGKDHVRELTNKEATEFTNWMMTQKSSFPKRPNKPYPVTKSQLFKINLLLKTVGSYRLSSGLQPTGYNLSDLCKHITKKESIEELDTVLASKFIAGLERILDYLQKKDATK